MTTWSILPAFAILIASAIHAGAAENFSPKSTTVVSLDAAADWLVAFDPKNAGREEQWWRQPRPEAKRVRVPGVYQEVLPGCHGVAWYWREVAFPAHPQADGRYLLRFWMVDYLADVWVNDVHVGRHEGGEEAFTLDVTEAAKPGVANRIAVRVLSPKDEPIDGVSVGNVPQRGRGCVPRIGSEYQCGGLVDSVELLVCPAVRIEDLFVRPDSATGEIRISANVRNAGKEPTMGRLLFTVAPAASGVTFDSLDMDRSFPAGDTLVETKLKVENPHRWNLNDPYLYRVTARVGAGKSDGFDEASTRCGFRDFRFTEGAFRLNDKRVFLKCSHSGNMTPAGYRVPLDPDLLRRDLLNSKVMGFNMIRFFCSIPRRYQLDLCDEIGLLVYEESFAGWFLNDSPQMTERFDTSIRGMIRRDRNHPSVVMWGLLNETGDGPVFRHAVGLLPMVRSLDDSRVTMLNSGLDNFVPRQGNQTGLSLWSGEVGSEPCVAYNDTKNDIQGPGITWAPGQLSLHPGPHGEYCVLRWTAPSDGDYAVTAKFRGIAQKATTDVHVLHQGEAVFEDAINLHERGNEAGCEKTVSAKAGDTIDFVTGWGNKDYGGDTTAIAATIRTGTTLHDAGRDFSIKKNPSSPWSYGYLQSGAKPDAATFKPFGKGERNEGASRNFGALCNPGSTAWEDTLNDQHPYQRSPHLPDQIRNLRDCKPGLPVFISEYGVCSAVDLPRQLRHYEQLGRAASEDARLYRAFHDSFMADWQRWNMADTFASPENYFRQCVAKMAGLRLLGLNAIRANPVCVGHSLTGTYDHGFCGEGATASEFRDLKPGATDALFDGFYPLRLCLFVESVNVYRGAKVRLDALLANEDALPPGEYPIRVQVAGPGGLSAFDKTVTVKIQDPKSRPESGLAIPIYGGDIVIDGPTGKYVFLAAFQEGGAATGGIVEFYVTDSADMPKVETDVALWGDDPATAKWLAEHGIKTHPLPAGQPNGREVILAGPKPASGDAATWRDLASRIARGSTAVFLSPKVFMKGDDAAGWLPLTKKGTLASNADWLYPHDQWTKKHPIFDGLPSGGLMDYTFYRNLISDSRWSGQDVPTELVAATVNTSLGYDSGTLVSVHGLGAGRFVLNTLGIHERLGQDPTAERLLRNLIRYAAADANKPLADLPPQFDEQLKAMGY